jgi:anaerobic magnesium-protoporphyrin IX monomethyl ester cyclase
MKPLFLFVRPPRPMWPFNGPATSFWPPLAFASMAAALRRHCPAWRVEILDAPPLEMGWRTLERELCARRPVVVAMGEEAVSCAECLRLARLAKSLGAKVIAGGCFFGHVAPQVLQTGFVDVIAHGEGENTIVELAHALRENSPDALDAVAGISFVRERSAPVLGHSNADCQLTLEGNAAQALQAGLQRPGRPHSEGEVVRTKPRPLIKNLDDLPLPAWDLLPMHCYGAGSRNHPGLAAIESSRGCFDTCEFCVLWRQMGNFVSEQVRPYVRFKSVPRLLEEIKIQTRQFGRRHLGWVDPCFNAHPKIPAELSEALLRENISVGQSAWVRADCLARDAKSGALAAMVRGGLNELYVGVERPDDAGLKDVHKSTTIPVVREAFQILTREYPQVFTLGTFVYGFPADTPETVRAIFRLSHELEMNHAFFIPLTPLPGTPYWHDELWDDTGESFRDFNFLPSATRPGSRRDLEWALLKAAALDWTPARIRTYLRGLRRGGARKRRVTLRLAARSTWFAAHGMLRGLLTGHRAGMVFPRWYES